MTNIDPRDVDAEFAFHLEMLTRRYVDEGMTLDAARAQALARLGDTNRSREMVRTIAADQEPPMEPSNRSTWMSSVAQDARIAFRMLRRTPLFTVTALLTIAVGVGATTAIFSVVNTALLRPLPYPSAPRVMVVNNFYGVIDERPAAVSAEELADYIGGVPSFDRWAALRPQPSPITGACGSDAACEPERVNAYAVSPSLFDLLGVAPALGRPFFVADGVPGAPKVVLLSDALWRRRYGADPSIVGQRITTGGTSREVIGVMPAGMRFPDARIGYLKERADLWLPISWEQVKDGRGNQYLVVIGRLAPTATVESARANIGTMMSSFSSRFPERYGASAHWRIKATPLRDEMVGDTRLALLVLFGAVACVLLIACANVANLTVVRGAARRREMAVRSALGANRGRLLQQLMIETLTLTTVGTVAGLAVAEASLRALIALDPGNIPGLSIARIDGTVLAFASLLAIATGVFVGLFPALRQSNANPQSALADGPRGSGAAPVRRKLRNLLVIVEVTMAVVVLVGAGLLIRSLVDIMRVPVGFAGNDVAVAEIILPRAVYTPSAKAADFEYALAARLAVIPDVTHASAVYPLPLSGEGWSGSISIAGRIEQTGTPEAHTEYGVAMPRYFETMRIPLIEGREFSSTDTAAAPSVGIVDADFAKEYFPGQSAVGKRVSPSGDLTKWTTIVGVVGHVRNKGAHTDGEGQFYFSAAQKPEYGLFFVTRSASGAASIAASIRSAVRDADPALPISTLTTMDGLVTKFTARERFNVLLFTIFGVVALALAAIGLYGVLASLVAQQTQEIGIRIALGGRPARLVIGVMSQGLVLAATGLALGLGGAALLSTAIKSLLFQVEPTDPLTYAVIGAVVVVVALAASYWPARRAMRINPVDVLR